MEEGKYYGYVTVPFCFYFDYVNYSKVGLNAVAGPHALVNLIIRS